MMVLKHRAVRRKFGRRKQEVTVEQRRLHDEEL
jgi:hypothetical protein